jgi:hypothetical protein
MADNGHPSQDARLPKVAERKRFRWPLLIAGTALLAVFLLPGAGVYHQYSSGKMCVLCHEVRQPFQDWRSSTHRNVPCTECHGSAFSLQARMHMRIIRELVIHLRGNIPEQVRLKTSEVLEMGSRCQKCHQQEDAGWAAGPHGTTYARIFLDKNHNRQRHLMDDCLRCHGMHFDGGIRDLVTPIDNQGPWRLLNSKLAQQPAIPCLACHEIHHEGLPLVAPAVKPDDAGPRQELFRPSLGLFDRRELDYVSLKRLPMPQVVDGSRLIKISPDPRQALCYQCHAPLADGQAGSGDDRTPRGVHEGLSCLVCHEKHGQTTRASCTTCHPRLSNCGLDVEKMDTTFKSTKSPHNVHSVTCKECHTKGVPKKRRTGV